MHLFSSSSDRERKSEKDGGRVPIFGSLVAQYVNRCDRHVGAVAWWRASIGADDLVLSSSFFRGWGLF